MKTADLIVQHQHQRGGETRIAAYQLVEYLERLGVEVIFGLCGHTVIAFLDALRGSRIKFISTRHEQVAAHAADGYARASGKPGVLMTHLGPGLTNAATGVANAALDSIPMVVIAGDVPSHYFGRHPHQEVNLHMDADQYEIYRPFCKRIYRVDRVADLPRIMERAFHLSQAGRPGPVLVDVPMDIFSADLPGGRVLADARAHRAPRAGRFDRGADRPGAGGSRASGALRRAAACSRRHATTELVALAEALEVPVAHTLMGKGCMREDHPLLLGMTGFWGTPIANETCRTADLIVAVGTAPGGGQLQFLGPALHLRHSSDPPDSHRYRPGGDRPQLPHRTRSGRRLPDGAQRDRRAPRAARVTRTAATCASGSRPAARAFASNWADQWSSDQYPMRPERILERAEEGDSRRRLHRDRRGLEQERRRPAVSHHGPRHVRHSQRSGDHGLRSRRPCSASRWRNRSAPPWR